MPSKEFQPPEPVGEPFRADPADPAPFATEGSPAQFQARPAPAAPQWPPQQLPPQGAQQPYFRVPQRPPLSPEQARNQRRAKIGLTLGILSILVSPAFGPFAIVLGSISIARGERKIGAWALSTGVAGTLIGVVLGILMLAGVVDPDQILQNLREQR